MDDLSSLTDILEVLSSLASDSSLRGEGGDVIDNRFHERLEQLSNLPDEEADELNPWKNLSLSVVDFSAQRAATGHSHTPSIALRLCKPMPDELINSWLARMVALNCHSEQTALLNQMLKSAKQIDPEINEGADLSSYGPVLLQVSKAEFLKHLCFDAFNKVLTGPSHNKPGTKSVKHLAAYARHALLKLPGKHLKFCAECVQEDLKWPKKFSYWRRAHQLAGCLWCETHGTPLLTAGQKKTVIEELPHQIRFSADNRLRSLTSEQVKILRRYNYIANTVLKNMPQIHGAAASEVFAQQARRMGLRTGNVGKRKTVSTYIQEILPKWWLEETFPRVQWRLDKRISAIDTACTPQNTQRYTTNTYCLLAAVFYDRAEEAFLALMNPQRMPSRDKGRIYWSRKEIFDLYVENSGNITRVAEKLQMNQATVSAGLRNQGLPALGNSPALRKLALRYLAGQPIDNVCESVDESKALEAIVRAACAPFKFALEAMEKGEQIRLSQEERQGQRGS